jgi:NADPH:quinone reductase-like Zn-dependent oxidoreductase
VDDGEITSAVQSVWRDGADKVLELVGTGTLKDSLRATRESGTVCMAGMVGDQWAFQEFAPMEAIPTGVSLTTYTGDVSDFMNMPFQKLLDEVAAGTLPVAIGRVFHIDQIVEAHRVMEANEAQGKIVILTR